MINSKKALIEALKTNKIAFFETLQNEFNTATNGIKRRPGTKIQTNAFTIETPKNGGVVDSWVWLENITVKDNIIKDKEFNIQIKIIEATK